MRNVAYGAITCLLTITSLAPAATFAVGAKKVIQERRARSMIAYGLVSPPPPIAKNDGHEEERVEGLDRTDPELEAATTDALPAKTAKAANDGAPPLRKTASAKPAPSTTASEADDPAPPPIDTEHLRDALDRRVETLPICQRGDGPTGPGTAEIVFFGDGAAQVELSDPYARTATGACVARRLASAGRVFTGPPVAVRVAFTL